PYLVDAPDVLLPSRRGPICAVPSIVFGSMANDGGHLLLDDAERTALLASEPQAEHWLRPFLGADEFINGRTRWCLWLVDCPPEVLRAMPNVRARVQGVKRHRDASSRAATRSLAATPSLFGEIRQPAGRYLLVPRHSSERREIIPIGFLEPAVIVGDANLCVPDATVFHFGVLTSRMHMAWVKYVCGRLESRYRYTNQIVYNNFPWPEVPTSKHADAIESAAQCVLDARAAFPGATLADLYDPLTMPPALLKAHQKLDNAIDAAYGKKGAFKTDAERVAYLFELYQRLTSLLPAAQPRKKTRGRATA
ncbi:type IIL restriction-modification enzyme MmeI, partial [Methylibium sp.]|uniref:type IIL restriction-modification enzyme MmeI n=1 Tax=Methylibium sp. TaxID=2067992 RepID=UPI0038621262